MLYIDIQKGKEAMKTSIILEYLEWNASCTKRLMLDIKRCFKLT